MSSSAVSYTPHYTVADYEQWPGDWELWRGLPVAMTPSPCGIHQRVARRLIVDLSVQLDAAACGCEVLHELDWRISDDTVVRPDVMVVCGELPQRHLTWAPAFIAEVTSPATEEKDRTAKLRLYELNAVPYYLIADPEKKAVDLFALDPQSRYVPVDCRESVELRFGERCRVRLQFDQLFK